MYALRKDHKGVVDELEGPPVRPICGAVMAYNRKLSHLMSIILNEVWKDASSVCLNTEEMLAEFRKLNDRMIPEEVVVGSADVKALYTSLDIAFTVEKVSEIFYNSKVQVEGIDIEELGLYLALNRKESELEKLDLLQFCPTRKTNKGRPPTITGCALDEDKVKRYGPWIPPQEKPNEQKVRQMFTEAIKIALLFIMESHVYTFDSETKLQSKGGPIGLSLTGALAQVFMMWWNGEFKRKMESYGLRLWLYKRYVDDIGTIMSVPKIGLRFDGNVLVEDKPMAEVDRRRNPDERTMCLFQSIANSIHPSIQMEIDYPSCHEDHKLPILDLKVWIKQRDHPGRQYGKTFVVLHGFFSKEVSSKSVISAKSAVPWNSKRTILTQEVLRILLNCSTDLPWEVVVGHLDQMMARIQYSGYDKKFRIEVLRSALKAYENIQELDALGERPMYRSREWRRQHSSGEKRQKRDKWYEKGEYESVIFVAATPDSALKRQYEKEIRSVGLKIKVVEQSGKVLKGELQRYDPFRSKTCGRGECMVCHNGGKGNCNTMGVTYELVCKNCEHKYVGETSRSAYTRGKEHLKSLERKEEKFVIWRHAREKHGSKVPDFTMNGTGVFSDDAMLRQITEAVLISRTQSNKLINNKSEWNHVSIPRAVIN